MIHQMLKINGCQSGGEEDQQVTHTPTENNTPDTDTHTRAKNNTPTPQTNTPTNS